MVVEYIASVDAWFVVGFVVVLEQILGSACGHVIMTFYQSMGSSKYIYASGFS